MAEKKRPVQKGGHYCVAGVPNNRSCTNTSYTLGISMHQFSVIPTVKAQSLKFVQQHRVDFGEPVAKNASLSSAHFEQSSYEATLAFSLDGMMQVKWNKVLIKGSVPTRHAVLTDRKRGQLRRDAFTEFHELEAKKKKVDETREESMSNLVDHHDDDTNEENLCNIATDVCMSPIDESSASTNASTATVSVTTPFTSAVALTSTNNTCASQSIQHLFLSPLHPPT
ncbi:hypothetical protein AWC38_SpisGene1984 [Stylophora pistillata]|uniref:Uncharacterized protein n=1 Tax=Stylophora pistillata TaxID=50429 RepID=A0A2B4SUZ8_STYPI|nr:hypothetical protein AWC38_SpisGene1984 [Stylophora pistillata]